jgi:type I restriction enzyme M protein
MRRNLGDKSHKLSDEHISRITQSFGEFEETERSKIFDNDEFGYRRIAIDQPLRLSFKATEERIESLENERAFTNRDEDTQERIKDTLGKLDSNQVWEDAGQFREDVRELFDDTGVDVRKSVYNAIERALGKRDPEAEIVTDSKGNPEHDSDLRQYERVPLGIDPQEYFENEVKPYISEAWINEDSRYYDDKDGELGQVGYEINFNLYFHDFEPPRPLEDVDKEIGELEEEIAKKLEEVRK